MNKGTKFLYCKECQRKRYCKSIRTIYKTVWTCSKRHEWTVTHGRDTQIVMLELERVAPKIKALLERDNIFLAPLKRR